MESLEILWDLNTAIKKITVQSTRVLVLVPHPAPENQDRPASGSTDIFVPPSKHAAPSHHEKRVRSQVPNQQESRREVSVSVSARAGREKTYGGRRRLAATSSTISGWGLGQATPRRRPPTRPPPASCCACAQRPSFSSSPPERRDLGIGSSRPPFILGPFPTGAEQRPLPVSQATHKPTERRNLGFRSAPRHGTGATPELTFF